VVLEGDAKACVGGADPVPSGCEASLVSSSVRGLLGRRAEMRAWRSRIRINLLPAPSALGVLDIDSSAMQITRLEGVASFPEERRIAWGRQGASRFCDVVPVCARVKTEIRRARVNRINA
jgi:hypothetical protein